MTEQSGTDARPGEAQDIGRHYWGYGIGLIALAWFAAPLVRYADAVELARCGLTAFLVVLCLEQSHKADSQRVRQLAFGAFVGAALTTILFAGKIFVSARETAWHNDRRCMVIEREMLRGTPRRDDLPEVFEAFGCRPQSNDAIRRPASTRADPRESLSSISGVSLAP